MSHWPRIATRLGEIAPFQVMDILRRARELDAAGQDVVHMEVGEPDFATPEPVSRAGAQALRSLPMHYTPAAGMSALREAIAGHYRQRHGLDIDPGRVFVTAGASAALQVALALVTDPGGRVLLTDPGYPCNANLVRLIGGVPCMLPVSAAQGWQPDVAALEGVPGPLAAMLLASPANPTGATLSRGRLAELATACRARGTALIMDEIYHGLTYAGPATSVLAVCDQALVVNSFSKYFHMTGWRLGWLVVPDALARDAEKLLQNLFIAAPTPAQHAALAAFSDETAHILEERRRAFASRRDYLLPALEGLGFSVRHRPEGAFYLYADSSALAVDSLTLTQRLLEQGRVAATPGSDFGRVGAAGHLRFAYTTSLERLALGVERMARLLGAGG